MPVAAFVGSNACFAATNGFPDDSPLDLKYRIHAIHNGPNSGFAACGFAPTTFDQVHFPGKLNNCEACHLSAAAEAHMLQNGGSKTLSKNADGSTAGGPLETCQFCHGPGRVADVKVMHGVDNFEFQAPVNPSP